MEKDIASGRLGTDEWMVIYCNELLIRLLVGHVCELGKGFAWISKAECNINNDNQVIAREVECMQSSPE